MTQSPSGYTLARRVMRCVKWKRDESGPIARQVNDGEQEVYYDTFIDFADLDRLAYKALQNQNQKAKDGPITVQVVRSKKVEEPHK